MNFKERQIDIYNKEISLNNETNELLYDILMSLSPIQRQKFCGYSVNDYETIMGIVINNDSVYFELDDGDVKDISYLIQLEQKEIIDYIMSNILKW